MGAARFGAKIAFAMGLIMATADCTPVDMAVGAGATAVTTAAQERPLSKAVSDAQIRTEINYAWSTHDLALYRKVNLSVIEGRVVLTGSVINPQTRIDAARMAWQADGVRDVINEIQVENWSGVLDRGRDEWIQAKIKSRLLVDSGVMSINYTIDCVNGTVYVMGIAQNQGELDRVINHVRDTAYVHSVVSYVRLKDDPARKT
jgi:osmotically-inducible protein OsmY